MAPTRIRLVGRASECAELGRTIAAARAGESRVLVLHGEPGVGKSALLEYLDGAATGMRVLRAAGVEAEREFAFATLHQLCAPLLDLVADLPPPQRDALETVFGIRVGAAPEHLLIGLAVLSLLSDTSRRSPVLCLVDDAQWMDRASAQVLEFVARRLRAEPVAVVFAVRERSRDLRGLPGLEITGLDREDAHALLASASPTRWDQHVRDRIVAETRGNPRALLEVSRQLAVPGATGGFGPAESGTRPGRLEQSYLSRVERLSDQGRLLLLVAATEPVGDPTLVWRAAEWLGVAPTAALDDEIDGLLAFEVRVVFCHPLVRSAVHRTVQEEDRRAVHRALAEVTDPHRDPDRRAWHLAASATGPDESVAAELERCTGRAQARGGLAAAAAFLQRSVELTVDGQRRAERAVAAADAGLRAGDLAAARASVDIAERYARDEFQRVRAELVRGHLAVATGPDRDTPPRLLATARRLEPFDPDLARETYLLAWGVAARTDRDSLPAISRAVNALPLSDRPIDLVLAGYALIVTAGRAAAVPVLQRAAVALTDLPARDLLTWGWVGNGVNAVLWEDRAMRQAFDRAVEVARNAGALAELPRHLAALGIATTWSGDFAAAADLMAEAEAVAATAGVPVVPLARLHLVAMQGRESEASKLIAGTDHDLSTTWATAVLYNGLTNYERVVPKARPDPRVTDPWVSVWTLPELIEAAVRVGDDRTARDALDQLADATEPCDTDWARGILARCRALLGDAPGDAERTERLYREAIERLDRTILRTEVARAHLLYGEWLRRQSRRADARRQLGTAHDLFVSIGMDAFAERARRELLATGAKPARRTADASAADTLTPQERQIALLVRDGLSNPEVSARLFLSPKTVEWHLSKVFAKLSITSRRQLRDVLPRDG